MENLSNIYGPVSRSSLIMTIQRESKQLQALERENKELRIALEDHQNALELIMSKYRMQISQLIQLHQRDVMERSAKNELGSSRIFESELIRVHSNKVMEMASVMRKAAEIDEQSDCEQKIILSQLLTENQGLREILSIARKSGSMNEPLAGDNNTKTIQRKPISQVTTAEKEIQTDEEPKSGNDHKCSNCSPKLDEASEVTE